MSVKSLLMIGSAFVAVGAFAQTSLGTVGNVQGLVTDTYGATVSSTVTSEAIYDGKRFVTSRNGTVTLELNNGCKVTLRPNQAVTIDARMTCEALIAAVQTVPGPNMAGGSFGRGALMAGGLVVGGYALHRALDKNDKISGL